MKTALVSLLFLLVISCSKSNEYIKTIESAIDVPILKYETVAYKDSGSLGYPVKVIDVTFTEAEFNAIVQKIDLKNYSKENNDYFRDFTSDSIKWHIALFSKENKIRYAEIK